MMLDPKGLEAARKATALQSPGTWMDEMCLTFLRTYLSTITPAEVGGVKPDAYEVRCTDGGYEWRRPYHGELEVIMNTGKDKYGKPFEYRELYAASLIQSQAARIAELEAGLGPFADVADHDIGSDEADDDVFRPMTNHNSAAKITVGHMRRTVALLNKDQPHD